MANGQRRKWPSGGGGGVSMETEIFGIHRPALSERANITKKKESEWEEEEEEGRSSSCIDRLANVHPLVLLLPSSYFLSTSFFLLLLDFTFWFTFFFFFFCSSAALDAHFISFCCPPFLPDADRPESADIRLFVASDQHPVRLATRQKRRSAAQKTHHRNVFSLPAAREMLSNGFQFLPAFQLPLPLQQKSWFNLFKI